MQININTDHTIAGNDALNTRVSLEVETALSLFSDHITRVEVHLSDENGARSGLNDKRCAMEARLEGRPPLAVTAHAGTLHQAVEGGAEKLSHLIDSTLGRAARSVHGGERAATTVAAAAAVGAAGDADAAS